jgi:hypothetical protein
MLISIHATLGFGRRISWEKDNDVPIGYTMSFKDAIHIVSANASLKAALPKWIFGLTKGLKEIYTAFDDLEVNLIYISYFFSTLFSFSFSDNIHFSNDRNTWLT